MKNSQFTKHYITYLSSFYSVVVFIYIFLVTFCEIPKENVRYVDTIIGFLMGTVVTTVINYFLGSSKSSNDKNVLLNNNTPNSTTVNFTTEDTPTTEEQA